MSGNRRNLSETLPDFSENLESCERKRTTRKNSLLGFFHLDCRDEFHRTSDLLCIRDRFDTGLNFLS